MYDYLIVGSGLAGATFAYLAHKAGKKVLVIEKRDCVGGNIACETIHDIICHKHGPHIFHTNNQMIWDFVTQFVTMNNYINSPLAYYKGELYNLPFNMNTFYKLFNVQNPEIIKQIIKDQASNVEDISTLEGYAISLVGTTIYEKLIKGYTEKQWGKKCSELPASIIKRIPLRFTFNNNYFNDRYQGIPIEGYNQLINRLLEGIDVQLNTSWFKAMKNLAKKVIFTGPIDSYFDYCFGRLEYRSLKFETCIYHSRANYQGNAVINYTDSYIPYTRVIEHKHFSLLNNDVYKNPETVVTKEYSIDCGENDEPYYPIHTKENLDLLAKYQKLAKQEHNVVFLGRLGEYKYYDMAPTIENSIKLWEYERER